eukprot:1696662-Amphidinium_carterae.1
MKYPVNQNRTLTRVNTARVLSCQECGTCCNPAHTLRQLRAGHYAGKLGAPPAGMLSKPGGL